MTNIAATINITPIGIDIINTTLISNEAIVSPATLHMLEPSSTSIQNIPFC